MVAANVPTGIDFPGLAKSPLNLRGCHPGKGGEKQIANKMKKFCLLKKPKLLPVCWQGFLRRQQVYQKRIK